MTGIVITGHGHFPSGLLSAVELVSGKLEQVVGVDFLAGQSADDLKVKLKAAVTNMKGEEVLILADLAGGTPFNMAAEVKQETTDKHIRLIAGTSMPAAIEAVFSRMISGADELAALAAAAGVRGVVDFDQLNNEDEGPEFEGGL